MSQLPSEFNVEAERVAILAAFKGLLRSVKDRSREDTKLIRKAFDLALDRSVTMKAQIEFAP